MTAEVKDRDRGKVDVPALLVDPGTRLGTRLNACRRYLIAHPVPKAGERKAEKDSPITYKYVAWDDVADSVGNALALHGIVASTTMLDVNSTDGMTRGNRPTKSWIVKVRIELVSADDPDDKVESEWFGGADDPETATGIAKATTYCVKDFLLKGLILSGDPADQVSSGADSPLGSALSEGDVECPSCRKGHLRQRTGGGRPFLTCSNWKPNSQGCNFKYQGSMTAYLDEVREKEERNAPTGDFKAGPDGVPVPETAADRPPEPPAPAPLPAAATALLEALKAIPDKRAARVAIIAGGGLSLVNTEESGEDGLVLRGAVLRNMGEPNLRRILAEVEALAATPAEPAASETLPL